MMKNFSHMRGATLPSALILCLCAAGLAQQGGWEKKSYREWTMNEAYSFLTESPWSQTRGKGIGSEASASETTAMPVDSEDITVRLRSALPVRQALARVRQLKAKYDEKNESGKASIDEKNKMLMECGPCADNYIVTLSPAPGRSKGVPSVLRTMPMAELKLNVTLSDERGVKRELVHFEPPVGDGSDAIFFFSRFDERGEPLITPKSKKLIVSFGPKILDLRGMTTNTRFEFDVSKMIVDGQVAF
jgi:hypothetical protein